MGAAGTAPPSGWQVYSITGGSSTWINSTGSNSTPAVGAIPNGVAVAGGAASPGLVVADNPTANQVNGYNATGSSGAAADRGIATAPTGIAGSAIELLLTNGTGSPLSALTVSYDIRRYQAGADNTTRTPGAGIPEGSEELPGYWLFYSLDNGADLHGCEQCHPCRRRPVNESYRAQHRRNHQRQSGVLSPQRQLECWFESPPPLGRRQCDRSLSRRNHRHR